MACWPHLIRNSSRMNESSDRKKSVINDVSSPLTTRIRLSRISCYERSTWENGLTHNESKRNEIDATMDKMSGMTIDCSQTPVFMSILLIFIHVLLKSSFFFLSSIPFCYWRFKQHLVVIINSPLHSYFLSPIHNHCLKGKKWKKKKNTIPRSKISRINHCHLSFLLSPFLLIIQLPYFISTYLFYLPTHILFIKA